MGVLAFALACCVGSLCVFGGQKLFSREGGLPSSRPRRKGRHRLPEEETELPKAPARKSPKRAPPGRPDVSIEALLAKARAAKAKK